jgi:hypothetical protein
LVSAGCSFLGLFLAFLFLSPLWLFGPSILYFIFFSSCYEMVRFENEIILIFFFWEWSRMTIRSKWSCKNDIWNFLQRTPAKTSSYFTRILVTMFHKTSLHRWDFGDHQFDNSKIISNYNLL